MVDELGLSGTELLVYALIYSFTVSGSYSRCSQGYIAERVGAGYSTVRRLLDGLIKKKYIIKLPSKSNKPPHFKAVMNPDNTRDAQIKAQNEQAGCSKWADGLPEMSTNNKEIKKEITTTSTIHSAYGERKVPFMELETAQNVKLTMHQYVTLMMRLGVTTALYYIRRLERCIVSKPEMYFKSHFETILKWYDEDTST